MSDDRRLVDLETRAAFQEDALEQLNAALVALRDEVDALRAEVGHLRARLRALTPSPTGEPGDEPPPPHY
jgi:SlyX protein